MSTQEVATKLVELCREGKNLEAINELYGDDVTSKEKGWHMETVEGKANVLDKNRQWYESVEKVHSVTISDPVVTGNFFACTMEMDITSKQYGRTTIEELAVYEVKDGKVIADQFFYSI